MSEARAAQGETRRARTLVEQLRDRRSRQVVFLSHCLLNENTRYLGGACRPACVREVVERCIAADLGIVQLPCPEQHAWGGVLKPRLLEVFSLKQRQPLRYALRHLAVWLAIRHTRLVYRRLARQVAREVEDYVRSGFRVAGIVGVDGSPSCGVARTLRIQQAVDLLSGLPVEATTVESVNACVRASLVPGAGLFTDALRRELAHRGLSIAFLAHDLVDEGTASA
jgi:predicted secreted protein